MSDWQTALETIKRRLELRLDNVLAEMKPNYDDSITGFNEAWDVMRALFKELAAAPPPPAVRVTPQMLDAAEAAYRASIVPGGGHLVHLEHAIKAALAVSFPIQQDGRGEQQDAREIIARSIVLSYCDNDAEFVERWADARVTRWNAERDADNILAALKSVGLTISAAPIQQDADDIGDVT